MINYANKINKVLLKAIFTKKELLKIYLICPQCKRNVPNNSWWIKNGCKWCQK